MTTSELIQLSATIVGIITSITAVIISIVSLKQTQKSIEEANRPYVVVYRDYIQVLGNVQEYFIIKNFGKTGAIIDSLDFDPVYKESIRGKDIFPNITSTFIAPGQSISTVVSHNAFQGEREGVIQVTVQYHSGKKHYSEVITLNEDLINDLAFSKTNPSKNTTVQTIIAKATQEILRRRL
ncbi:hypothetical protein [Oceanobacillus indicireducens]|uniref:Uncharacterized protein n=1 Tax=Oceanobacillus indicireducens TaxID=1004261 RepID=A0A917XXK7_9BACI|nr:hypothetical protein [Oceanobacillus indicireducens]GGN56255.1 hypothetical protein GCM10007971_15900 [Oceanobacillus indicireducens]